MCERGGRQVCEALFSPSPLLLTPTLLTSVPRILSPYCWRSKLFLLSSAFSTGSMRCRQVDTRCASSVCTSRAAAALMRRSMYLRERFDVEA
jgi:hypothetical protein